VGQDCILPADLQSAAPELGRLSPVPKKPVENRLAG
jgi:hypothetical protein